MAVPGDLEEVSAGINKPIYLEIALQNITKTDTGILLNE